MKTALIVTAIGLCWAGWQLVACLLFPFAACGRCHGDGRKRSPSGTAWRRCGRCKGSGERVRLGRRLWDSWTRSSR